MSWTVPPPAESDGSMVAGERVLLLDYLGHQRRTLLRIAAGLTGEQLTTRAVACSSLTLLGLIRHLRKVERIWFRERFGGERLAPMYDPTLGTDADFTDLRADEAERAIQALQDEWARSDAIASGLSLDATIEVHGDPMSLRFVYLHLIHEYARHNGHADLIRQAIDGVTGR